MNILRVGFTLALAFAFPLMVWETRVALYPKLFGAAEIDYKRFASLTFGIVVFSLVLGALVKPEQLSLPLGLIGSTASPILVFVVPALMYRSQAQLITVKSTAISQTTHLPVGEEDSVGVWAAVLLYVGVTLVPVCLGVNIWQATSGQ
jgi:hypothetical protein